MSPPLVRIARKRRWPWLLALAIGMASGLAAWKLQQRGADVSGRAGGAASGGLWPSSPGPTAVNEGHPLDGHPFIPREPVGDARPADISPADWAALNKALETEPDKAKERERLVAYLRFQRAAAQWREMQDSADVARRQALGRELVEQLPQHVAKGEVNAGEAIMMMTSIGEDLEPDVVRRKAWMEAQRARMTSTQNESQAQALAEEKRKNEEFARLQAEIVARWQNGTGTDQDPSTLERQLQALREKVYGSGP